MTWKRAGFSRKTMVKEHPGFVSLPGLGSSCGLCGASRTGKVLVREIAACKGPGSNGVKMVGGALARMGKSLGNPGTDRQFGVVNVINM